MGVYQKGHDRMTGNGYKKLHPLSIKARAEMLESVAGYDSARVEFELADALLRGDTDAETLQWIACLIERRLVDLGASHE